MTTISFSGLTGKLHGLYESFNISSNMIIGTEGKVKYVEPQYDFTKTITMAEELLDYADSKDAGQVRFSESALEIFDEMKDYIPIKVKAGSMVRTSQGKVKMYFYAGKKDKEPDLSNRMKSKWEKEIKKFVPHPDELIAVIWTKD